MAAKTGPLDVPRFQVLTPAALEAFTKSGPPDGAFVYTTTPEGDEDALQQWVRDHWEIVGKVYIGDAARSDDLAVRVSPAPFSYGAGGSGVGAAPRGPNDPSLTDPMGTNGCPPCPPVPVITCEGSLLARQVTTADDQGYQLGSISMPVTVLPGEQSIVIACLIADCDNIPPDQNLVATGDYTQLAGNVNAPAGNPTTGVVYRAALDADDIVTAAYTPGFDAVNMSSWAGVAMAFRSGATTPRQEAHANFGSGSSPADIVLPGNVLPTSIVIVTVGWRNKFPVEPAAALSPAGAVLVGSAYATSPPGGSSAGADSAAIYAYCGASGDTFSMIGNNDQKFITVSEWVV